jgi:hypothetical protein
MVLNYNLTLSNDTIAMYASNFRSNWAPHELCQGVNFVN